MTSVQGFLSQSSASFVLYEIINEYNGEFQNTNKLLKVDIWMTALINYFLFLLHRPSNKKVMKSLKILIKLKIFGIFWYLSTCLCISIKKESCTRKKFVIIITKLIENNTRKNILLRSFHTNPCECLCEKINNIMFVYIKYSQKKNHLLTF